MEHFLLCDVYKCLNQASLKLGFDKMITNELKNWEMVVGSWFLVLWGHRFSG